jgi:protein required for attachment to host cells/ribosome-associated translation inhibitor RaiA
MAAKSKPTWIAVMDGTQARFYALRRAEEGQVFEEVAIPLAAIHLRKPRALRNDKPGRRAGNGARHAVEARTDYYKLETANFAREVAGTLDAALAERRYDRLVIVAPPRNLPELRQCLTMRVREAMVHEIPKNFANLGTDALWEKLSGILLREAKALNGAAARVATQSGGSLPVSVVFRGLEASPAVQASALKHAAKLGRKFSRIINCRVTIEAQHRARSTVKMFRVAIDLKVPGRDISSKAGGDERPAYADIGKAMREAFATATRQMQDHILRMKDRTVRTRRQSSPRTRGEAVESD